MHFFTPNHVQLLNSCYPPPSALPTAGPDYLPNSQELSRLTYYASNHPGKLTKIGLELEKRVKTESKKTRAGNPRTRISLLMTLSIFRSLAVECRRDIALLSSSLMTSIKDILQVLPSDLEVVVRAASLFTAWTTYTDGHLIGTDSNTSRDYLSVLHHFSILSCSTVSDEETRNRTRLIGFAALAGASNSDALCHDSYQFSAQVSEILPSVLSTLFDAKISVLDEQAAAVKDEPWSPYLAEFRTRPAFERRAASIHIHVDGDKGPSVEDVSNASLRTLFSLVSHANGGQLGLIMTSSFECLDDSQAWGQVEHCCWFARKMVEWAQYQYRFVIPTWLIERLCKGEEILPQITSMHIALAAMATTVFNCPVPLVNLSTTDMISSLTTVLLRRIEPNRDDPLVSSLIKCISSLGSHIYYSDQIRDLAAELINRITVLEAQGALNRGKSDKNTTEATRSLLAALMGLIQAAHKNEGIEHGSSPRTSLESTRKDLTSNPRVTRRAPVPIDMWQETLILICDHQYAVRADYTDTLIFYLREEMPKSGELIDSDHVKRIRRLSGGPIQQALNINLLLHPGNSGTKFLHAIHGYLYILATSPPLGSSSALSRSPPGGEVQVTVLPPSREERDDGPPAPDSISAHTSHSTGRRASAVRRLLDHTPPGLSIVTSSSGSLSDYVLILDILTAVHEELPVRALVAGVPMLLALEDTIRNVDAFDDSTLQRANVIREVLARVWRVIGTIWNSSELVTLAEEAISSSPNSLPVKSRSDGLPPHLPARPPVSFLEAQVLPTSWKGLNAEDALAALTRSTTVQEATGLDQGALRQKFSMRWTAEFALGESMERFSVFETTIRGDGVSPLLKISPALMQIDNISQQSLARSARGVGVADLRGALEGRNSLSNPALNKPPSLSTLEHTPSTMDGLRLTQTRSKSRTKKRAVPMGTGDVRDVLQKLGIGKQNGSFLKSPLKPPLTTSQ